MSQETRSVCSSETPEAHTSASRSRPASGSSPAVANVRTLQDVERDIAKYQGLHDQAMADYAAAMSGHKAALAEWQKGTPPTSS